MLLVGEHDEFHQVEGLNPTTFSYIVDKHGATRTVYSAKINIHRARAEPIFLGIPSEDLQAFSAVRA